MTDSRTDTYDSPWKEVIEHAFPEFMAFYFPDAYAQIDWARGHEFKNTELRQVMRDAELGKRFADALAQVTIKGDEQRWIYVHIEIQGQRDNDFARRMFVYNYRLYDRYALPIASLGVCPTYGNRSEKVGNRGHFFANFEENTEVFNENLRKTGAGLPLLQPIQLSRTDS